VTCPPNLSAEMAPWPRNVLIPWRIPSVRFVAGPPPASGPPEAVSSGPCVPGSPPPCTRVAGQRSGGTNGAPRTILDQRRWDFVGLRVRRHLRCGQRPPVQPKFVQIDRNFAIADLDDRPAASLGAREGHIRITYQFAVVIEPDIRGYSTTTARCDHRSLTMRRSTGISMWSYASSSLSNL